MMRQRNKVNVVSDGDLERQSNDGQERIWRNVYLQVEGQLLKIWNKIFVVSCVIAVTVNPLFFYVPSVNEEKKCIGFDRTSEVIAICLRSVTDLFYATNIILRLYSFYIHMSSHKLGRKKLENHFYSLAKDVSFQKHGGTKLFTDASEMASRYLWKYFIVDILCILPIPQVVISNMFLNMDHSNYLETRAWMNLAVFLQYVPRVLRIYLTCMELTNNGTKWSPSIRVKAAFNLFLYILGSHVLGAFWYFLSIERETACWLKACKKHVGCVQSSFPCKKSSGNYTFLNDLCPVNTPDLRLFDFGIFLQALQSGKLEATDFPKKLLYCFWWGLRNVSSYGQNLQTSTYFWENCFAVCISIYGLILFLYFVGNLQVYLTSRATKSLTPEAFKKMEEKKEKIKIKRLQIGEWVYRNKVPRDIRREILSKVEQISKEHIGVDVENLLPLLSPKHREEITARLCLPLLNKVESEALKKWCKFYSRRLICKYLKPVYYNENSDIVREGEPLDKMVLITSGTVLMTDTISNGSKKLYKFPVKGQFFGEELLDWGLKSFEVSFSPNLSDLTIYTKTVKTHTKFEAFILTAKNLKDLVDNINKAVLHIQRAWRRKRDQCNHCQHCHHYHHQPQSVLGANSAASPSGSVLGANLEASPSGIERS